MAPRDVRPEPHEGLVVGKLIGRGGNAVVYGGYYRGEPVAIKVVADLREPTETGRRKAKETHRELVLMRLFGAYPEFVKILLSYMSHDGNTAFIVMNYFASNAWKAIVRKPPIFVPLESGEPAPEEARFSAAPPLLNETQIRFFAMQALVGLYRMHGANTLHRDMSCGNLLLSMQSEADERPRCAITDFGLSRLDADKAKTPWVGTPQYKAPEVLLGMPCCLPQSDIWSLACILVEMLTGKYLAVDQNNRLPPLAVILMRVARPQRPRWCPERVEGRVPEIVTPQIWENWQNNGVQSELPPELRQFSAGCQAFLRALLTFDYEDRPTAEVALSHAWFDPLRDEIRSRLALGVPEAAPFDEDGDHAAAVTGMCKNH